MFEGLGWPGKGEVMGAMLGVLRRGGALVTTGTSFQFCMPLAWDGGGTEGVELRGGAPIGGGPVALANAG